MPIPAVGAHHATIYPAEGVPIVEGMAVIAKFDCPSMGLFGVRVMVNTKNLDVMLTADCGCTVLTPVLPAIVTLAAMQGDGHTAAKH